MREFASNKSLTSLSYLSKTIYSFFCLFSLVALAVSLALYEDLVGPTPQQGLQRIRTYYTHQPLPQKKQAEVGPQHGPTILLPDEEPEANGIPFLVPKRKLLEVTHFHLFTIPVFLLVLTHLFLMTPWNNKAKMACIVGGWGFAGLHIATPWLLRIFGGFAWLHLVSGGGMFLFLLVLTIYPAFAMWRKT